MPTRGSSIHLRGKDIIAENYSSSISHIGMTTPLLGKPRMLSKISVSLELYCTLAEVGRPSATPPEVRGALTALAGDQYDCCLLDFSMLNKSHQRSSEHLPALWSLPSIRWTSETSILEIVETGGLVAAIIGRRAAGPGRAATGRRPVARHVPVDCALGIELITGQRVTGRAWEALPRVTLSQGPRGRAVGEATGRREPATPSAVWGEQVSSGTKVVCV